MMYFTKLKKNAFCLFTVIFLMTDCCLCGAVLQSLGFLKHRTANGNKITIFYKFSLWKK